MPTAAALRLLATLQISLADRASSLFRTLSLKAAGSRAMLAARALRTFSLDTAGLIGVGTIDGDGGPHGGKFAGSPISIFLHLCDAAGSAIAG